MKKFYNLGPGLPAITSRTKHVDKPTAGAWVWQGGGRGGGGGRGRCDGYSNRDAQDTSQK